jgi:hypothetical protein
MSEPIPRRYQLFNPVSAVKLREHPGSTLRSPTGILVEIPAEAVVECEGLVAKSGLINVLWNDDAFSVYYDDFKQSSQPTTES